MTSQAIKKGYQFFLLVDPRYPVKELRIIFQLEICLSVQAHHIIQLSVWFWMQRIQITCYRIQKRGGTERVRRGAPVQGQSSSASCTTITITSNELNHVLLLLLSRRHKPQLTLCEATLMTGPSLINRKHSFCLWFSRHGGEASLSKTIFLEQTNLHKSKPKTGTQETCFI